MEFIGRKHELGVLGKALERVRAGVGGEEPGVCLLVHGRRRVGKSRLVERFIQEAGVPAVFFTASRQTDEPSLFVEDVAASDLPDAQRLAGVTPADWESALRLLDGALPDDRPSIVVIDEFPYLVDQDASIETVLQKHWDRRLKKKPVLLLLVGSDIAVMEQLNSYGRGFHQRGSPFPVGPLSPPETAEIVRAPSEAAAFDAYLITGGLPLLCEEWPAGARMWEYLEGALADPTSALIVSGELMLAAEFPAEVQARAVLNQIGAGERTFSNVARAAGGLQAASLNRSLSKLLAKRVVARDLPLSTRPSKEARYSVADPYLRFWLRYIGPNLSKLARGRSDLVLDELRRTYADWRGRAIEPVARQALNSAALADRLPGPPVAVGGYWTRTNTPEVDLIGADREPVAGKVCFAGTIKWNERGIVTQGDLNALAAGAQRVPGADASTPLVVVARGRVQAKGAAAVLGPADLLAAWD